MKAILRNGKKLVTTEAFLGNSIEEKVRRITASGEPIEAVSPMVYTERKDGVRPDTNIRTDKWEIAQEAMNSIAEGTRQKRKEKIEQGTQPQTQEVTE